MKVSEMTLETVKQYLRVDGNDDDVLIDAMLDSAIDFVCGYVGCDKPDLDKWSDIPIVILNIVSDTYEVRQFTTSTISENPLVMRMLARHCSNFLPEVGE